MSQAKAPVAIGVRKPGCCAINSTRGASLQLGKFRLPLVPLLHQLAGNDLKDLLDPLTVLGTDFMAAVPANILTPEATTALAVGTLYAAACRKPHASSRRRGRGLRRVELLGNVGDGALKGHAAARRVERNNVRLGADNMNDQRLLTCQIILQLQQPSRHLLEAFLVGDVVAEQTRVGAAVIEAGNTAKTFLARRVPYLEANGGVGRSVDDALGDKGRTNSRSGGGRAKVVIHITMD